MNLFSQFHSSASQVGICSRGNSAVGLLHLLSADVSLIFVFTGICGVTSGHFTFMAVSWHAIRPVVVICLVCSPPSLCRSIPGWLAGWHTAVNGNGGERLCHWLDDRMVYTFLSWCVRHVGRA